jgi:hypothetical protein
MRPLSPSRNRETYVYVREHIPTRTHTPTDCSPLTYIDDTAAPRDTTSALLLLLLLLLLSLIIVKMTFLSLMLN